MSRDHGRTWSTAAPILVRQGFTVLHLALGAPGQVAMVMTHRRDGALGAVELVTSADGGDTWGQPRVAVPASQQPFLVTLAARGDGTLGLLFYDARDDVPGAEGTAVGVWMRTSSDDGTTWHETRVSGPFDREQAPFGGDLGQYQALVPAPGGFAAAYTVSGAGTIGKSDVHVAVLRVDGTRGRG
jgi:hypothetical protein